MVRFWFTLFISFFIWHSPAVGSPTPFAYQGQIVKPNGAPLEAASVTFTIEVLSPPSTGCVLYKEQHVINMTGSNGIFSFEVGTGSRAGGPDYEDLLANDLAKAISNSEPMMSPTNCAVGGTYTPANSDGRDLRVTFDDGSGPITLSTDHSLVSVPFANSATSIDGLTASDILTVDTTATNVLTQANLVWLFETARYSELQALVNGTSTNYLTSTPSAPVSMNSQRISDVATPTAGTDAANKDYTDQNIGGQAADSATLSGLGAGNTGEVLYWTGTQWSSALPAGDSTKLPLAGGTMTGAINMGNQDITNANNISANGSVSANGLSTGTNLALYNGANYMGFQAAAGSADLIWTLPAADGTAGQLLSTDGSGVLSWVSDSAPVDTVFGRTGAVIAATSDYDANQVDNTPAGNIAATDVQAAIDELDTEKLDISGDAMTGALTMNAENEVRFSDNDDSHYVGFKAPAVISAGASFVWTLPDDDGGAGEVLTTDGAGNLVWATDAGGDITGGSSLGAGISVYKNENAGVLEFASINAGSSKITVTNDGGTEVDIDVDESNFDQTAITNTPAGNIAATNIQAAINELDTEKVDSGRTLTAGNGLTGTGDLSADRTFDVGAGAGIQVNADDIEVDINGTGALGAAVDNADEILVYDTSGTALVKATRSELVLSEAEVDAYANNNGYLTAESDTLANVTGRGASTATDITMSTEAEIQFADSVGGEYAAIKAPNDLAANYVLTLPADDGTANQVLETDGAGNLSWVAIAAAPVTDVFGRTGNVIAATSDYDAVQVDNTPAGNIAATDVQGAIDELDTEKVDSGRNINTVADSGLTGGGDLSADRSLSLDIAGTTDLGAAVDNADSVLIYDNSGTVLREATRAELVLSEAEVDALVGNNGYVESGSSQGAGVAVFDNLNGTDLEFRSLVAASSKVTISPDVGNKEVDIDVDESQFDLGSIPNTAAGDIAAANAQAAIDELDNEKVAKAGDSMAGALTMDAENEVRFADNDDSHYVGFKAPAVVAAGASFVWTLPDDDGGAGEVLTTDGSGNLVWATDAGGDITGGSSLGAGISVFKNENAGVLEFASINAGSSKITVTNDGGTEVDIDVDESNFDQTAITNTPAGNIAATNIQAAINELDTDKVATTRAINTAAGSGLQGGGDLSSDRSLSLDIPNVADLGAAVDNADTLIVYDASGTAIAEATRAELVLSEAEVDAYANNNGYAAATAVVLRDGSQDLSADWDVGGVNTITNLPTPSANSDASTKQYVDSSIAAISTDSIEDADANTTIQVEEGANDDTIRFDTAGSERAVIEADGDVAVDTNTLFVDATNNRVGVGNIAPNSPLEVTGDIQIGNSAVACVAGKAGSMRYVGGNVEFCDGSSWTAFGTAAGGEVNDGTNVGAGTGQLYAGKTGSDIEFKSIAAGSTKLSITNNATDVTLDVAEANLNTSNIPNTPAGNIAATNTQAAIDELDTEKLGGIDNEASLTSANIWVGDGTNVAQEVAMSGDIAIDNAGATTIQANAVTSGMINDGEIANADISATAAIARSKIASSGNANRLVVNDGSGDLADAAAITASRALASDANGIPVAVATTATELGYVNGVTSAIQTQIDGKVALAGDTMTGNLNLDNNSALLLSEADGSGTDAVTIQSLATLGAPYTLTLPPDDGTAGQVLQTDGSGVLTWASDAGGDITGGNSVGTSGIDVYRAENSGVLEFASIDAASSAITVAFDGGNNSVDIDVDESQFDQTAIPNTAAGDIAATNVQGAINELDNEKVAKAGDNMAGALTMDAENEVRFADNDDSHYVGFKAPAVVAAGASFVWTLPDDDGGAGEVLTTDGSGNLVWATDAGGDITGGSSLGAGISVYKNENAGVLEFASINAGSSKVTVTNDGGTEVDIDVDESNFDQTAITNTPAGNIASTNIQAAINELDTDKVATTRAINTAAGSGLQGGGDLSSDRSLSLDIPNVADLGAAVDNADTLIVYDASGTAIAEATRAELVLTEAEVDGYANNNGYAASSAVVLRDGSQDLSADWDVGGTNTITNLPTPTAATEAATKGYVDTALSGISADTIQDADTNTLIQVEEGANDDTIRFDTAGSERAVIEADGDVAVDTNTLFVDATNNRVGVGNTAPSSPLEVTGDIQIGNSAVACVAGKAGSMRYVGGNIEFCDGSSWTAFGTASGGEVNDGTNVGGGTGQLYAGKTGNDIEFKSIAAGSTKLSITNNATDVTLDVAEANLNTSNIPNTPAGNIAATNTQAAIDELDTEKLGGIDNEASLTSANIWVGDGTNVAQEVAMSGDIAIDNAGATTIQANAVTAGMINDGEIANADISATAAIARSKIASSANANRLVVNDGSGDLADAAAITASRALASDANGIPVAVATTSTELGYVNGVTSAIQTQIDGKQADLGFTPVDVAGDTMTGNLNLDNNSALLLSEADGSGTDAVTIQSLATLGAPYTLTLPPDDGTNGQVLQTDGSGVLTWASDAGGDITGGSSLGAGISVYKNENAGVLEFASIAANSTKVSVTNSGGTQVNIDVDESNFDPDLIPVTPAGGIASSTVNDAIFELDTDKLATSLTSANIFVGSAGNVATGVAMSGDIAIDNAGATTIQANAVTAGMINDGEIANADISATAAIARSKIATSANANRLVVNDGSGDLADAAAITAGRALASDANGIPVAVATTATELGYVNGVTSAIQTQLNGKQATITADSLNFTDLSDSMVLDATTTVNMDTNTADLNFDSNTLVIDSSANNVGIGSATPRVKLDVAGAIAAAPAVAEASDTVDYADSNFGYTAQSCGAATFDLHNMKDGSTYTLAVQGTTTGTCAFNAYSDAGTTALTVKLPPSHGASTAGTETLYSFVVIGTTVYVAWVPGY